MCDDIKHSNWKLYFVNVGFGIFKLLFNVLNFYQSVMNLHVTTREIDLIKLDMITSSSMSSKKSMT